MREWESEQTLIPLIRMPPYLNLDELGWLLGENQHVHGLAWPQGHILPLA